MAPISQPVVVPPSEAAVVLVLTLREGNDQAVVDAIADLTGVIRAVAFRYPDAQTTCVAGIGSHAWDRLFPGAPKPKGLHPFIALDGGAHVARSTPGDLVLHVPHDHRPADETLDAIAATGATVAFFLELADAVEVDAAARRRGLAVPGDLSIVVTGSHERARRPA